MHTYHLKWWSIMRMMFRLRWMIISFGHRRCSSPSNDVIHGGSVNPLEWWSPDPVGAWVNRLDVASASDELDVRVFGERTLDDETYEE